MVSNITIAFMSISLLISFGLPVILTVYIIRHEKASFKAVLVGALVFFVFQIVIRMPLLQVISRQTWYFKMSSSMLLVGLFLGLSAGLFEEIGRFLGFKYLLKNKLTWENGIAYGIGHGGIEAILLVGLSNLNSIIFSILINNGLLESTLANRLSPDIVYSIKYQLISITPALALAGGLERLFTIIVHIAFSIIVLYGVMSKEFKYVVYAIFAHTLINAPLPILMSRGVNIWIIEAYIGVFAAIGLYIIIKSKEYFSSRFSKSEDNEL